MAVWFTSDTHFGHAAIIRLAQRPFDSVEAMDEALISRWNATVAPEDTVWHLGDFCHRGAKHIDDYRARLNGTIHLIVGNHDAVADGQLAHLFASIQYIAVIEADGQTLALCHYPMREWPRAWSGGWHLHGHVHGIYDDDPHGLSLDVGADSHGFRPINVARIGQLLAGRANPFADEENREERARRARQRR